MDTCLILMRHAKSSWEESGLADFERPLTARGAKAAPGMARWLAAQKLFPEAVLASPAERARSTAALVKTVLEESRPVHFAMDRRLYEADLARLLDVLREQQALSLLLVGHNPGCEDLLHFLVADEQLGGRDAKQFPTAAMFVLALNGGWQAVGRGSARLLMSMRPRDLPKEFLD